MLVPSQNPDGVDIVGDYYRSTLGTPTEGRDPPELYHKYVGHDDNRDWYAFTQPETRYTVDSLYTPWDPQIVNDIHQQGVERRTHLHSAVHGSDRAEHRSDSHRGDERPRHVDRVADDEPGLHRHRQQRVVRPVVAGASVFALSSRRAAAHRDGERASRDADRHSVRPARRRPRLRREDRLVEFSVALAGRTLDATATSCAIRPRRAGRSSSTRR